MMWKKKESEPDSLVAHKDSGKKNNKSVIWGWIIFYMILTLIIWFRGVKLIDYVTYAIILVLILLTCKEIKTPAISIWFFGLSTLWHIIGVFPLTVDGNTTSLYALFGHYDTIGHFTGFLLFTVGFLYFYHANRSNLSKLDTVIMLVAIVGIGALIEVSEYVGYRLFGKGGGWLKFGEGDNSMNFGPWGDSMTDTLFNILGILSGFLIYNLISKLRTPHKATQIITVT